MNLTCRLKSFRRLRGYSQTELAQRASVAQSQISKWEGGVEIPQIETLMKLGKALHLPWHMLISARGDADDMEDLPGAIQDSDGRWLNTSACSEDELYITREQAIAILIAESK